MKFCKENNNQYEYDINDHDSNESDDGNHDTKQTLMELGVVQNCVVYIIFDTE